MVTLNTSSIIRTSVANNRATLDGESFSPFASTDGRFVIFISAAANLVAGDLNGSTDVFLRDTLTGSTRLVSASVDGVPGNAFSGVASVSDDGRFVAFTSGASNLVPNDTGVTDVFVADMQSGTTIRLSQPSDQIEGNGPSTDSQITRDGRFVVFESEASNLVENDANNTKDIFVRDLLTNQTVIASRSGTGARPNGASENADISGSGRFVAFTSSATNLVAGDTNGIQDVFLRDLVAGTTIRVTVAGDGRQSNGFSDGAQVSDDGRFVVFASDADNLVAGDSNGDSDIFLRDTVAGTTKLVSISTTGARANDQSFSPDISADGRFIVFDSYAGNLVAGDAGGRKDVFLRDTVANTTTRLSVGLDGAEANDDNVFPPRITADGRFVVFDSAASNLVPGDINGRIDTFRVSLFATNAADRLLGSDGADAISGLGGADIINAGLGADTMNGGTGDDTFFVDNGADRVLEGAGGGTNDVVFSAVSFALGAGQQVETLATSAKNGTAAINLNGNEFRNTLSGNAGKNVLNGLGNRDVLIGNAGQDSFAFSTALGAANIDTINDLAPADDTILLFKSVFANLSLGVLGANFFKEISAGAQDANDRVLYNKATGAVFYDADGAGWQAAQHFATLVNKPASLGAADFIVV